MIRRSVHPEKLPWYVSGAIEPLEAEEIRAHLAACDECREQAANLASLGETMVSHRDTPHPPARELVAHARDELEGVRGDAVRYHLSGCASCQEDLGVIRQEVDPRGVGRPEWTRLRGARWTLAASLLVAAAGGAIAWSLWRPPPETITLLPSHRSTANPAVFTGSGPWTVTVALPFDSPDGEYLLKLEAEDRSPVEGAPRSAARRDDGTVIVTIPALSMTGRFRLILTPPVAAVGAPYEYTFQVAEGR